MKKWYFLIASLLLAAALPACRSTRNGDYEQLSDEEVQYLVKFAHYNIITFKYLTDEQVPFFQEAKPQLKCHYTGDKSGKFQASWSFPINTASATKLARNPYAIVPHRTINARGTGDFRYPKDMTWSISVFDEGETIIKR